MTGLVDQLVDELRFAEAAAAATEAGEHERATILFGIAGDLHEVGRSARALDVRAQRRVAAELSRRSLHAAAAVVWEAAGEFDRAELAYARGHDATAAARCASARGDDHAAAAHLEQRLRTEPSDDDARIELAKLTLARGRAREAAALAAAVATDAEARPAADTLLTEALRGASEAAGDGRFFDLRPVATTPHARILSARDRVTGERVAVKIVRVDLSRSDLLANMEREARTLSALRHPHVVPLVAFDAKSGVLVTRWMGGGSLRDAISGGPLAASRVAEIGVAVAGALAAAHSASVVHRDVTPSNVLFDDAGAAYLSDFGAAHVIDAAVTVTAGLVGTLAYLAPEVRRGEPATPASDVFALGCVLFEALSGDLGDGRAPSALGVGLTTAHDDLFSSLRHADPPARPSAAAAQAWLRKLVWPHTVATKSHAARAVDARVARDLLGRSEARTPADATTLRAARVAAEGAALGLSAIVTIRSASAEEIVSERLPATTSRPLTADEEIVVEAAKRFFAARGVASKTLVSDHRGPVVVPIALMPR